jgi:hypothetical protein
MLRCPAIKCDCHIAVCLLCCLAPSILGLISKCAHVGEAQTCYQNVLILLSCVNTSDYQPNKLYQPVDTWLTIMPTKHSSFVGCHVSLDAWPPTLWTTVRHSVTPGTTHPATEHRVTDSSTWMILGAISEVPDTNLIWDTSYNDWGFAWLFLVPTHTLGCAYICSRC